MKRDKFRGIEKRVFDIFGLNKPLMPLTYMSGGDGYESFPVDLTNEAGEIIYERYYAYMDRLNTWEEAQYQQWCEDHKREIDYRRQKHPKNPAVLRYDGPTSPEVRDQHIEQLKVAGKWDGRKYAKYQKEARNDTSDI